MTGPVSLGTTLEVVFRDECLWGGGRCLRWLKDRKGSSAVERDECLVEVSSRIGDMFRLHGKLRVSVAVVCVPRREGVHERMDGRMQSGRRDAKF